MSAPVTPRPSLPMEALAEAKDIDDVLRNIEQIIDWSINAESHLGYFAVIYKRVTLAVREAIKKGEFEDGQRIEQLDVAFAQRYFNALNAYFHPGEYQGLTLPWEVAFVGDQNRQAIILQHTMTAFNAHISFDLGLACLTIAPNSLDTLENDFDRVNALLCSQIPGMLAVVQQLSPELRWARRLIPDEVGVFKRLVMKLREGAWLFAIYMAMNPDNARAKRVNQASWTAALGSWYMQPTPRWTPFPMLVGAVAKHESRNVVANIRALERLKDAPDALDKSCLPDPKSGKSGKSG
jgi:hypothetical protein